MMRLFLGIGVAGVVIYAGLCVALYFSQRSLIYLPQPRTFGSSETLLRLQVTGAELDVSIRPMRGPNALLYFGGNAEDVSVNLPFLSQAFPDHALYLLHYRGYGGSSGTPSEEALHADALVLFDRAHAEHSSIVLVGRSLGSGIAIRVATERPVSRLVLVTPYDSLQEIAARQFPYVPVRWLLRDKFESWRHAPRVSQPTTIVVAENDEIIPRASSDRLHARFARGVALYRLIPAAGHNTISESPAYLAALISAP